MRKPRPHPKTPLKRTDGQKTTGKKRVVGERNEPLVLRGLKDKQGLIAETDKRI